MYYDAMRKILYVMILAGIFLIILGLWQYLPHTHSSETPNSVYMSITAKRVVFPLLGVILTALGITLLKFVGEVKKETLSLRDEIINLTKKVEKNSNNSF
ncbi:hypothetical protein PALU110988_20990 [Paenibacillus lupini]|uniref:hypothetical protein n=1 Tax=Paenibacillus lupini TaxID=1450204 RepID=UPI001424A4D7|nr:hypothetical protein [Paenibacillus lupini]NIK22277.1 lysylphosphatidylglycerol synthetase-like protein (DUF2156 family) [Paenibacillus lupini]